MSSGEVVELLEVAVFDNPDATGFRILFREGPGVRTEAAHRLAHHIASRLLEPADGAFEAWVDRYNGGGPHDETTKGVIEAYLVSDFTPTKDPTKLGSGEQSSSIFGQL